MINFRKNELFDALYKRYILSFNLTLDTIDSTGIKFYDFYQKHLSVCFKHDLTLLNKEIKFYNRFIVKKRKIDIKLENLNFIKLSEEDIGDLSSKELKIYIQKQRKFDNLQFKYFRLKQKYYFYIQEENVSEELEQGEEVVESEEEIIEMEEEESTGAEDTSLLAQSTSEDVRYESSSKDEVSAKKEEISESKDERKRQEGLLEAFFGNENCGEKDQKENEKPNE